MDRAISLTITDKLGKQFKFETFKQFEKFVVQEHKFWQSKKDNLSGYTGNVAHYLNAANYFQQTIAQITNFKDSLEDWDDVTLQGQIDQHISSNIVRTLTPHWLWSSNPFIDQWLNVAEKYGNNVANSFIEAFIDNHKFSNLNNIESLKGAVLAYEFELQDESTLTKRRSSERASISKVRNDLVDVKDSLFIEVDAFQKDFKEWDDQTRIDAQRLYSLNKKLGERQASRHNNQFDTQMNEWHQNIENLEHTYKEKLRLEKPAQYWNKAAKKYGIQGGLWVLAIVALVVVGIINFQELFVTWLQGKEIDIQLNSVQGIILFGAIAAVYAYLMRVLSRLAFSSFHLMRDAEEREQLTYLYLSLTNEAKVDEKSREIVLQALFSRAETGLLSGESKPTMPGLNDLFKASSGK